MLQDELIRFLKERNFIQEYESLHAPVKTRSFIRRDGWSVKLDFDNAGHGRFRTYDLSGQLCLEFEYTQQTLVNGTVDIRAFEGLLFIKDITMSLREINQTWLKQVIKERTKSI